MKLTLQSEVTPEVYATIQAALEVATCSSSLLSWLAELIDESIEDIPENSPAYQDFHNAYKRIMDETEAH